MHVVIHELFLVIERQTEQSVDVDVFLVFCFFARPSDSNMRFP